jgi:hypothetical protein
MRDVTETPSGGDEFPGVLMQFTAKWCARDVMSDIYRRGVFPEMSVKIKSPTRAWGCAGFQRMSL